MISGVRKYRKEGINEQNNGNYVTAIEKYKQARGEARGAITNEYKEKHHLIYGLIAEVSTNIAECMIDELLEQYEASQKSLNDCLPPFKEIVTELTEAQNALKNQIKSMKDAYRVDHASIQASNKELTETLEKVKRQLRQAKITLYWNEAVANIRSIDKKFNALEEKVESHESSKQANAEKKKLTEELKEELTQTLELLKTALATAKKIPEDNHEACEIKELMVDLYETNGDIFSLMESDVAFYHVKQEYLDFMLEQYGNAFHIARAQESSKKEEVLPLYFSVLNVLEDKAKQVDKIKEFMDENEKFKLINACVEIINFTKKYPLNQFANEMSAHEKLELQSYLFTAHHLLSKHYVTKPDATKTSVWHMREQKKGRKAHEEQALEEADKYCKLAKGVEFEKDAPLYQGLQRMRFYVAKKTLMNTLHEVALQPTFSQNTASLCVFLLSQIHGLSKDKKIFSLFNITKESGGLKSINFNVAMDLFVDAIILCEDQKLKNHQLDLMKRFIKTNKLIFARVALENANSVFFVRDEALRKKIKACLKNPATTGSDDELTTILYSTVKGNAEKTEVGKISKSESKTRLLKIMSDYFTNLETLFSKDQVNQSIPKLLKELGTFLKQNKYPKEVCSLFENAALDLLPVIRGEVKLWKEAPVENPVVARKALLIQMQTTIPLATRAPRSSASIGTSAASTSPAKSIQIDIGTKKSKSNKLTIA